MSTDNHFIQETLIQGDSYKGLKLEPKWLGQSLGASTLAYSLFWASELLTGSVLGFFVVEVAQPLKMCSLW